MIKDVLTVSLVLTVMLHFTTATCEIADQRHLSLEGLSQATILLGREASQAASVMAQYLTGLVDGSNQDHSPCFMEERNPEYESENTNFHLRLIEDHRSAEGYLNYLHVVKEFYGELIAEEEQNGRACVYCSYLADLESSVDLMTRSLSNLVCYINTTSPLSDTATPTQEGGDQSPDDQAEEKAENDFCSSPCYQQQLQVFNRLTIFASEYINTDIAGYEEGKTN